MSFWQELQKPLIGLSPMDGITDHPFRHITKKYGNPAIMYTEFTSVEGVCHGALQLLKDFLFDETQRPIIGQIYGTTPDFFRQTAILLCQLGFDGIDINMGCPAKNVAHSGAGAALIQTPKLAQEIIRQTKLGVEDWMNGKTARDCGNITKEICQVVEARHQKLPAKYQERRRLPVSVKTRIGYDAPVIEQWIPNLLEMEPAAIALHGRTLKQHYSGQANWEMIGLAAEIAHTTPTLLLGNGDVSSLTDAHSKIATYKTDGALLGRITMGNPFVFLEQIPADASDLMFKITLEHAKLFEETYKDEEKYNFLPMRKHLGWSVHDIENAAKIRQEIYQCNSSSDFVTVMEKYGIFPSEHQVENDILQPQQSDLAV
jgi:tRNA-dihydrouridine synthase B